MTKKPRNRKNSNMKRLTLMSQRALKNVGIVFTLKQKATFIDVKTGALIPTCQSIITAAKDVQHPWRVYIAVMLENQIGEQYIKIEDCTPERRCYQEDMLDALNTEHIRMTNETKLADRVNLGWLAIPSGQEVEQEQIVKMLEKLPCWDQFERGEIKTEKDKARERAELIARLEEVA